MTPSFKSLAAVAVLGACSTSWAQSSVSVYGLIDLSAGQFQNAGATKIARLDSGNMATSYLGFKGTEDLGGGLKAKFALESFLRADTGAYGRFGGDNFWTRAAWVGLEGGFGTVSAGRTTNQFFLSTLLFNAFGDSFGYSPSIRQFLTPSTGMAWYGDTGWSNSALYQSPKFGGLSVNLQGALGEGAANATGPSYGGNVIYFGGGFGATFAYQHVEKDTSTPPPAGFEDQTSLQLGLSYDFGPVKLFAQLAQITTNKTAEDETKAWGVGASVPVGAGKILVQYNEAEADFGAAGVTDVTNKTLTAGYDYFLSKRTDLYAVYMNDKLTGKNTGNTWAVGMKHTF
jgi:predicted porin